MKSQQQIGALMRAFNADLVIQTITPLVEGLSNDNYLVSTHNQSFLLKHYRDHWPSVGLAAQSHFSQHQLCPAPLWQNKEENVVIFEYIEGKIATQGYHHQLIDDLVLLHQYQVKTESMDVAYEINYYQTSSYYMAHQALIRSALDFIDSEPKQLGFCHNDLVKENIIDADKGMLMIDFEYAKSNDVYFDLAALAVSFQLTAGEKAQLLKRYQSALAQPDQFYSNIQKLDAYQFIFLMLCICWYEQRGASNKVNELKQQLTGFKASWS